MLKGKTIGLCVTGSIAAYKAIYLMRLLTEAGAQVRTAMTRGATSIILILFRWVGIIEVKDDVNITPRDWGSIR